MNIFIYIYTHTLCVCVCVCVYAVLCCAQTLSCVWLFVTPWTIAHKAPPSMGILQARILEWVAMPFSRGSFWTRNWTGVSCIAGGFFSSWATREALCVYTCIYTHITHTLFLFYFSSIWILTWISLKFLTMILYSKWKAISWLFLL